MPEQKTCRQCQSPFTIDDRDRAFYAKMQVPEPTLCPECRLQRRLAWRMEWTLYMRKSDLSGCDMLSIFPPDSPYTVYHHEDWYGSKWNLDFGRDFDFSRSFFEQMNELLHATPLLGHVVVNLQNCEYVNQTGWSKNCYFTIEADHNEDTLYGYRVFFNKNCMDCLEVWRCERCYECTDCEDCFFLYFSQLCKQCRNSSFLFDCRGCSDCFGCTGLRKKQYCMFNEQLTKEEYESRMLSFDFYNPDHTRLANARFEQLKMKHPRKNFTGELNDNVSGNYINQCKDCLDCFGMTSSRDCRFCDLSRDCKDCMDFFAFGDNVERVYEVELAGSNIHNIRFCVDCWEGSFDLSYCIQCCLSSGHCFGCVGLKKQEYCILNKQYSKDEYEKLVPKIIEYMKATGEWGEFFPMHLAPYAYNETTAQEYYPLTEEEILAKELRFQKHLPFTNGKETISHEHIPWNIEEVPDSICNEVLACEATGRNYRITKQELLMYRAMKLPIPRIHFYERHRRRSALRNPHKHWKRECMKCQKEIETSYQPSRPEIVYCEECYLKEVY